MPLSRLTWSILATAVLSVLTGIGVRLATDWPAIWRSLLQALFTLVISLLLVAVIQVMARWLENTLHQRPGKTAPASPERGRESSLTNSRNRPSKHSEQN